MNTRATPKVRFAPRNGLDPKSYAKPVITSVEHVSLKMTILDERKSARDSSELVQLMSSCKIADKNAEEQATGDAASKIVKNLLSTEKRTKDHSESSVPCITLDEDRDDPEIILCSNKDEQPEINIQSSRKSEEVRNFDQIWARTSKPCRSNSPIPKSAAAQSRIKVQNNAKMFRNVAGKYAGAVVEPGISKHRLDTPFPSQKMVRNPTVSAANLEKPEYNSIICTINKLNETRKEKVMKNIEQVPENLKTGIMGKVSATLDFPANKSIFKDLIDLTIDEKDLPPRMTRTKDPEPRPKDSVPNLSDFFVPRYRGECFEVVNITPNEPEMMETLDPSRVMMSIAGWKNRMNEF